MIIDAEVKTQGTEGPYWQKFTGEPTEIGTELEFRDAKGIPFVKLRVVKVELF